MKKLNWFEILLLSTLIGIGVYAALSDPQNLSQRWFTRDDAYYYFKVAQNITEGKGITFDGINPTNGFHPLWMVVCIPIFFLARFDLILPLRVLLVVMSGLSAGTGIILYRLTKKVIHPFIGMMVAFFWVFNKTILFHVYKQGLETGIAAFFISLFIYYLYRYERPHDHKQTSWKELVTLGLAGTLAIFSRLDLVFIISIAGIWVVFNKTPLRYLLPFDIISISISSLLALIIRVSFVEYLKFSDVAVAMVGIDLVVKIIAAYSFGLYQKTTLANLLLLIKKLAVFSGTTSVFTGIIMIFIIPIMKLEGFPRSVIIYNSIFTFLTFGFTRFIFHRLGVDTQAIESQLTPFGELKLNWKKWLLDGSTYFGVIFGLLGTYMVWNKISFGTFSPVSGQIKRWWGSLSGNVYGGPAHTLAEFFGVTNSGEGNTWYLITTTITDWSNALRMIGVPKESRFQVLFLFFVILFTLLLFINKRKTKYALGQLGIIPLVSGGILQTLSYHITGYSAFKEWYWIAQPVATVLILGLGIGLIFEGLKRFKPTTPIFGIITTIVGLMLTLNYWVYIKNTMPYNHTPQNEPYNDIATYLEERTEPGSIIGMTGGGNAGYFIQDRVVINMDGLINSFMYYQLLKDKNAGAYLADIGMDYVLANPLLLKQLPYRKQFQPYLKYINERYGGKELMIFDSTPED